VLEKGTCPFYKYKITENSEILGCTASGEFIPVADSESLTKVAANIDETCLGFDFVKCPHYKKKTGRKNRSITR
jgi:hypothetical protein